MFTAKIYNHFNEEIITLTGKHYPLLVSYTQAVLKSDLNLNYAITTDSREPEQVLEILRQD